MHCGFLPRERWTDPASIPERFGGEEYGCDLCPGAACRRPLVNEVAAAYTAFRKGQLEVVFPDPANSIVEGVLILERAVNALEQYQTDKLRQKPNV